MVRANPVKLPCFFPARGSQYLNMGRSLCDTYATVASVFKQADMVMAPRLGQKLSDYFFIAETSASARQQAEEKLKHTRITQPAVLAMDIAIFELLRGIWYSAGYGYGT